MVLEKDGLVFFVVTGQILRIVWSNCAIISFALGVRNFE